MNKKLSEAHLFEIEIIIHSGFIVTVSLMNTIIFSSFENDY